MDDDPRANAVDGTMERQCQSRLRSHLEVVARERDIYMATGGRVLVREYLRQQLGQWGPVQAQTFEAAGLAGENLVLQLPGVEAVGPPLLVGAHYDGVPGSPGADDNATGVAVLLELARAWSIQPLPCPVQLVAFDLEEYGLLGSWAYIQRQAQNSPLRLMLSLEMLGYCDPRPGSQRYPSGLQWLYPRQGNFIALVGNLPAWRQTRQLSQQMRQQVPCEWLMAGWRGGLVPATRRSDHAPFWDSGYQAIMVTDTSFLRNPHYHQPSDRPETLDFAFLTRVCLGLEQGLRQLMAMS